MATATKRPPKKREKQQKPIPTQVANDVTVRAELERIAADHDGYLRETDVVEVARDPASPLHSRFCWDDTEAAEQYRRIQAAQLIRHLRVVVIRHTPEGPRPLKVRVYESAPMDRHAEGGYRDVQDIMANPERRQSMVQAVAAELAAIRQRYANLNELAEVWTVIDKTIGNPS